MILYIIIAVGITFLCGYQVPRLVRPLEAGYGMVTIVAIGVYLVFATLFWIWFYQYGSSLGL